MNTIIEKIRAEVERRMRICERVRGEGGENQDYYHGKAVSYNETLTFLSNLEKEEKPKRVLTLEKEFDGYNPIVVTLDKYVLEGIGIGRHDKVIIKIQRKED